MWVLNSSSESAAEYRQRSCAARALTVGVVEGIVNTDSEFTTDSWEPERRCSKKEESAAIEYELHPLEHAKAPPVAIAILRSRWT